MADSIDERPMVDIPRREMWLWENKEALEAVQEGIADLDEGRMHEMNSEAINRIERSFRQAERGELKEIPPEFLEFDEDEE